MRLIIWSALVSGSLLWNMKQQQQSVLKVATATVRANINKDIGFRKWATSHGGVYVTPSEHTPPNPYLRIPERDVVTTGGKELTLMNPAYVLRQIQTDFSGYYGTRSHITSLKPINPDNAPDAWEVKALHYFEQGGMELLEEQQIDGQPYLRMMLPFIVEKGCLKCHAQQGYKLGDIRGGISSSVSLTHFIANERLLNYGLLLTHGLIWLIGLAGLAWMAVSSRRIQRLEIISREAALIEESERRFRAVAQSANDAIVTGTSTGNIVGWNAAAERLFGYTEAEINGQPLTILMPERFRSQHSEGLARVVAGGMPHVIGKTVELAGLRKDGSEFPLEFSLAQWQANGQFFTALIRNITERKKAEKDLKLQRDNFMRVLNAVTDGIYIVNRDYDIEYINPVIEHDFGKVDGRKCYSYFHDRTEPCPWCKNDEVFKGKTVRWEWHSDKTGKTYDLLDTPIANPDGTVSKFEIFHDITELKQTEDKISRLNEELELMVLERTKQLMEAQEELVRNERLAVLGQVSGSVGHELRNPLGVMNNAVYFLQTALPDADGIVKEYLGILRNEIGNSERIVSDLLESVRTRQPHTEIVDVAELVAQTLGKCAIPATVTVRLKIPENLPPLKVDAMQIQQVLRNLISNGIEAMPDGGTLEIGALENMQTVSVIVKDSGVGMTQEQLGRLFQPLFTTKAHGIGLGMVVVKNLTQANGGRIEVASEAGSGTTFTVTLPV